MKRFIDLILSLSVLFLLSPLLVLLCILVFWKLGRPIFFIQRRPGYSGKIFTIYKFRTMREPLNRGGETDDDSQRLNNFGNLLRNSSLDELPELWNVLKGDMSIVGPRPLLVEYLPLYNEIQMRRHEVLPGITGWAQVNGRNTLSWDEKFELDVWYVDNKSFFLDVKIILMTFIKVLSRDGISSAGHVTMTKFQGNQE